MSKETRTPLEMSIEILSIHLSNPNSTVALESIPDGLEKLHDTVSRLSGIPAVSFVPSSPAVADAETAGPKVTSGADDETPADDVPASQPGAVMTSRTEKIASAKLWPDATDQQRKKFLDLFDKHALSINPDTGYPETRVPVDKLAEDTFVRDPFTGKEFSMLKRHINTAYGLSPAELIAFFNLPADFPFTAPSFSKAKKEAALKAGLGRKKGAAPTKTKSTAGSTTKSGRGRRARAAVA